MTSIRPLLPLALLVGICALLVLTWTPGSPPSPTSAPTFAHQSPPSPTCEDAGLVRRLQASTVALRVPGQAQPRGSGTIVRPDTIVTCGHVCGTQRTLDVLLSDGRTLQGTVSLLDSERDLALVVVTGAMPALTLAREMPAVGDTVLACGSPCGYQGSVSRGIVSALGRQITMPTGEVLSDLLQTDAAINPGNSGGSLVNDQGEIVGVVVALREGAQGIGFAHPAAAIRRLLERRESR